MFADLGTLHREMLTRSPSEFVSRFLFDTVPFLFGGDLEAWLAWKSALATGLDVDPRDIVLTGSGALGYSLNPKKNYKAYDDVSDIDCGVISPYHFDVAWRYLRQMRPSWLGLDRNAKNAIEAHRKNHVFSGTIATDKMLSLLPFGTEWQRALDSMGNRVPTVGREVKLRIYRDYDSLRQYQSRNISILRSSLGTDDDEAEIEGIPIEDIEA